MNTWIFGVAVRQDAEEYVASVRDLPEALISQDSEAEALVSVGERHRAIDQVPHEEG